MMWAEGPREYAFGARRVQRLSAPGADLKGGTQFEKGVQRIGRQRVDLVLYVLVGRDLVHLHAGLSAGDRQRFVGGHLLAGQCSRDLTHDLAEVLSVAL